MGVSLDKSGKIYEVHKPETIDEIDKRFATMNDEIAKRHLHPQVSKYCKKEYLVKDYFHTIHESVKGILDRLRELTNSNKDGYPLLDEILDVKNPVIVFNDLSNDNEKNAFKGFRRLIEGLISMFRNPTSHMVRIKWEDDVSATLEVLSTVSLIHRYIDKCKVVRKV